MCGNTHAEKNLLVWSCKKLAYRPFVGRCSSLLQAPGYISWLLAKHAHISDWTCSLVLPSGDLVDPRWKLPIVTETWWNLALSHQISRPTSELWDMFTDVPFNTLELNPQDTRLLIFIHIPTTYTTCSVWMTSERRKLGSNSHNVDAAATSNQLQSIKPKEKKKIWPQCWWIMQADD